jgi:hypothetical protein
VGGEAQGAEADCLRPQDWLGTGQGLKPCLLTNAFQPKLAPPLSTFWAPAQSPKLAIDLGDVKVSLEKPEWGSDYCLPGNSHVIKPHRKCQLFQGACWMWCLSSREPRLAATALISLLSGATVNRSPCSARVYKASTQTVQKRVTCGCHIWGWGRQAGRKWHYKTFPHPKTGSWRDHLVLWKIWKIWRQLYCRAHGWYPWERANDSRVPVRKNRPPSLFNSCKDRAALLHGLWACCYHDTQFPFPNLSNTGLANDTADKHRNSFKLRRAVGGVWETSGYRPSTICHLALGTEHSPQPGTQQPQVRTMFPAALATEQSPPAGVMDHAG